MYPSTVAVNVWYASFAAKSICPFMSNKKLPCVNLSTQPVTQHRNTQMD